jgi:hypothetical protein
MSLVRGWLSRGDFEVSDESDHPKVPPTAAIPFAPKPGPAMGPVPDPYAPKSRVEPDVTADIERFIHKGVKAQAAVDTIT